MAAESQSDRRRKNVNDAGDYAGLQSQVERNQILVQINKFKGTLNLLRDFESEKVPQQENSSIIKDTSRPNDEPVIPTTVENQTTNNLIRRQANHGSAVCHQISQETRVLLQIEDKRGVFSNNSGTFNKTSQNEQDTLLSKAFENLKHCNCNTQMETKYKFLDAELLMDEEKIKICDLPHKLKLGELNVIYGGPGMGKTTFSKKLCCFCSQSESLALQLVLRFEATSFHSIKKSLKQELQLKSRRFEMLKTKFIGKSKQILIILDGWVVDTLGDFMKELSFSVVSGATVLALSRPDNSPKKNFNSFKLLSPPKEELIECYAQEFEYTIKWQLNVLDLTDSIEGLSPRICHLIFDAVRETCSDSVSDVLGKVCSDITGSFENWDGTLVDLGRLLFKELKGRENLVTDEVAANSFLEAICILNESVISKPPGLFLVQFLVAQFLLTNPPQLINGSIDLVESFLQGPWDCRICLMEDKNNLFSLFFKTEFVWLERNIEGVLRFRVPIKRANTELSQCRTIHYDSKVKPCDIPAYLFYTKYSAQYVREILKNQMRCSIELYPYCPNFQTERLISGNIVIQDGDEIITVKEANSYEGLVDFERQILSQNGPRNKCILSERNLTFKIIRNDPFQDSRKPKSRPWAN